MKGAIMFELFRSRMLGLVGIILFAGLTAVNTAGATRPTREDLGVFPYAFSVDCSPHGFDFTIDVRGEESVWVETFYDENGEPTRTVVHSSFKETDTNVVSGKALSFGGLIVRTFDLITGTRTDVGRMFLMTDPGRGMVIQDVGRVVFDAPFHVSFEAGHHEVLQGGTGSHLDELVCTALAGS
jgi:hypothetical protein